MCISTVLQCTVAILSEHIGSHGYLPKIEISASGFFYNLPQPSDSVVHSGFIASTVFQYLWVTGKYVFDFLLLNRKDNRLSLSSLSLSLSL